MGKTEKGAIWLNDDEMPPYEYWQFWRNTDDRDVKKFLNFFTELDQKEIENIYEKENINNLKILLANEATKILYHGKMASKKCRKNC